MVRALEKDFVDITVNNNESKKQLNLCVSSNQWVHDVLQLASARLIPSQQRAQMPVQIRREGDVLCLDPEALVGEALCTGDRLILEVAAGADRLTSCAGENQSTSVEDGGKEGAFTSAAARIAGESVSADSAKFLDRARSTIGE
jgi:hypothetical protein